MKKMMLKTLSAAVLASTLSMTVSAQVTTSALRGVVTDSEGLPVSGATVQLINTKNGLTKTVTSDSDGSFNLRNLAVSGGYVIVVEADNFAVQRTENVTLNVGETANLDFALSSAATEIEEIVVLGSSAILNNSLATGPSASFNLSDLKNAPAINRSLTDVIRADARVYIDEGGADGIQCGGQNPRFNSLTVDGVRMNDLFGLNSNGYPTERMPFSFDAIEQVAVELAPFDVEYGGFSACNINAVTKSGGNEFFGSVFYNYADDSLRGDSLEGKSLDNLGTFDVHNYGFTLGGPIINDSLFFFVAYEYQEDANKFDRGPEDSGAVDAIEGFTQAQLDEIVQIAADSDLYNYDVGGIPSAIPNEDEKLLVKIDWNISDAHRIALTYNYNDGNNFVESDGDLDEFEFENHLYERGAELKSAVVAWYADWNQNFSTELRVGKVELDNRQNSIGGTDFGEIRVELDNVDVYLGGDDSRQSNDLDYDVDSFAFKGAYFLGGHEISFGIEREALDIYNLFVQHTETEIRFDGIDNFRNGFASAIYYNNAPSADPTDAAADWGYAVNSIYAQDEFSVTEKLTLTAGLRYEWYTSDDKPVENTAFTEDYGFPNNATVDGEGLLQPRVGLTYDYSDQLTVRAGFGLFSGGNPNVWLSNNYSNNNILQVGARGRDYGYTDGTRSLFDDDVVYELVEDGVPAGPGYGVPKELVDAVATGIGSNFEINYLDPNFEIPSEWKYSLGATYVTTTGYEFNADLLVTQKQDAAMILRGDLEQVGTDDEGHPQYESERLASFVLTNSDRNPLSLLASVSMAKEFDNGLSLNLGYAYSDAKDTQPMTSAVAFSNYQNRAFFDPQEDVVSTSEYNIAHRFTSTLKYSKEFFGDNTTTFTLFTQANQGQPYSLVRDDGNSVYGFTPFLDGDNVLVTGTERNDRDGSWWVKADFKISQEFPGFLPGHKAAAFFVVDNFTNLLNDEWGILREVDFPANVVVGEDAESRNGTASLYQIQFGVQYDF